MSSLRLFTLGSPRLERDGVPLDLQYRKNIALIAYLAVTGQRHTRESLVTLFWPELEPGRARARLRSYVSALRKALDGEFLVVDRQTAGLDPEVDLWFDLDQFHSLLSSWRSQGHPEACTCPDCLIALAEAVELYQGDFLSGFSLRDSLAFDEWQLFQTEELRQELDSALERLVRGHSAQQTYVSALPYARRRLALDPLHEPAHQHLMQLYAQIGQRAAALRQYAECARILDAELDLSPSEETTALYERIRAQSADLESTLLPPALPPHNLPAQTTPFVGRKALLTEIAEQIRGPDCRLLSLLGPGGIGKTRLALEAAREHVDRYRDGVYWVSLAPVHSTDRMVLSVAQAIGLVLERAGDPWQQLLDHLQQKRMLLVLDNLEHLLDIPHPPRRGAVDLVGGILQAAPNIQIVTASRARVNVQSECLLPVAGMETPKSPSWANGGWTEEVMQAATGGLKEPGPKQDATRSALAVRKTTQYPAVQLFLATARRVRPGYEPTAGELADVVRICTLVEGIPLMILMAAAWMEMLSVAEIVAELEQGYDLLETDLRDLPERQRSMEAVHDGSWRMLDETEREAAAGLSVFRGGFTRDAAEKVAGTGLRTLIALVHKSFLQRDATGRYEMHELLRQYAEHKLAEIPEEKERISDLHCHYYADLLQSESAGFDWGGGLWGFLPEVDNVRAGWSWAVSESRYAKVYEYTDLFDLYWHQGVYQEAVTALEWAVRVLRAQSADEVSREGEVALALTLVNLARMYQKWDPGERIELREALVEEGVSILCRPGARRELARIAPQIAWTYGPEHDAETRELVQESLAFLRELGDVESLQTLLGVLGEMDVRLGAYDEAERHSQEAISIAEKSDGGSSSSYAVLNLAKIAHFRGDLQTARQLYEDSLARVENGGQGCVEAMVSSFVGDTALAMGDYLGAREYHQRARSLYETLAVRWADATSGQHYGTAYSLDRLGDVALAVGEIGPARAAYRQAIQLAHDHPCVTLNLDVVVSHAALAAFGGDRERAVELAALVLHHPKGYVEVKGRAQRLLEPLESDLPPDIFVEAQQRGWARDLEATVNELLAEFQNGQDPTDASTIARLFRGGVPAGIAADAWHPKGPSTPPP